MLLAEKYAIADLNAVKSYERREGRAEGQGALADAIKRIHAGETIDDLIKSGVDEKTATLAYSCR